MPKRSSRKKIKNIFQDSFSIINNFIVPPLLQTDDLGKLLIAIEENHSWNELKKLVKDLSEAYGTEGNFHKLNQFLLRRWARIMDVSPICYTQTYQSLLTQVCEKIAARLAASGNLLNRFQLPAHRLELLLPGVDFSNDIVGTQSLEEIDQLFDDKKIKLSSFKLDYIRNHHGNVTSIKPLYILDCLDSSRSSKKMSNPNKAGNPILLNSDVDRIRYHSREAFAIYTAIRDYYAEKIVSPTLGGFLYRLIDSLRAGGVRKSGEEEKAGQKAYEGVKIFYEFCQTISPQHYQELLACTSKSIEDKTFKYVWYRLLSGSTGYVDLPLTIEDMNEIAEYLSPFDLLNNLEEYGDFCVEVFASTLERMLHHNDNFYMVRAMDESIENESINYKLDAEYKLEAAEVNFIIAVKNENIPNTKGFTHYALNEIALLSVNAKAALGFGDTTFIRTLCENLVTDHNAFFDLLCQVKSSLHPQLLTHIPIADIQAMLNTADILIDGFKQLLSVTHSRNTHIAILDILGSEHLGVIFNSITQLLALGKIGDALVFMHLRTLFTPGKLLSIQGDENYVRGFINTLPPQDQVKAYAVFGISLPPLPDIAPAFYNLPKVFSFFAPYNLMGQRAIPKLTHRLDDTESESNKRSRTLPLVPLTDNSILCDEELIDDSTVNDDEDILLSRLIYSRR
jgi:hypothetical protein